GYGLVHIEARHGKEIRSQGYNSVLEFIEDVAKNFDVIKEGIVREGRQTYMLQLKGKHNKTLMIELVEDGGYYTINTAGVFKNSYGKNRKVVYDRHTTEKQPVEAVADSQLSEQRDTTDNSRMDSATLSSEGKDSALSSEKQEEKYYGADTVPTDEILRGMSYEQVEEQAALYSEKIAERYDTQIELAEAEATVIEDKWRRTPQEGRHLKALKEKIANLRERREAEMRVAGRRFNEALKNHPDRPKPLSLADIAEAEEAAERDKSLSVDDKDDTIYVSDSARSARRGVAQAKEASEKAVGALVDTVWNKDSYSEAEIDELERANADARTAYHEKLDEYADALLKATEEEVDSFAGQINRGVARAEHEEITNLSRDFNLKDETRKKFEAFAGRLTEAIERQRSAKAYGEATDISNFEAKRPKKFSIDEASADRSPNAAYVGVSH
ncbi:MAG: hypothetical protein K2G64_06585, partial [Muribaculaceae bacterium]|nr:hypothetical protein [Muribaculaceae bacterium]